MKEAIKVIGITTIAILIPAFLFAYCIHIMTDISLAYTIFAGIPIVVTLIALFGLHKPAYENYNQEDEEDDEE